MSVGQFEFNGEEYCERHDMLRNEERCRESSCCHWNDYEEGEASFNGQGRCWSDIGTDTCTDMHVVNGEEYCERHDMLRNEERCRASSCCQWNDWEEGDASFNGQGRCWSYIGTETCTDMSMDHRDNFYRNNFYRDSSRKNFYRDSNRNFYREEEQVGSRDQYNHYNDFNPHNCPCGWCSDGCCRCSAEKGEKSVGQFNFNGEEYCERHDMLRNEESCRESSCCHWNDYEEGEASFNGQ